MRDVLVVHVMLLLVQRNPIVELKCKGIVKGPAVAVPVYVSKCSNSSGVEYRVEWHCLEYCTGSGGDGGMCVYSHRHRIESPVYYFAKAEAQNSRRGTECSIKNNGNERENIFAGHGEVPGVIVRSNLWRHAGDDVR